MYILIVLMFYRNIPIFIEGGNMTDYRNIEHLNGHHERKNPTNTGNQCMLGFFGDRGYIFTYIANLGWISALSHV